MSNQNEEEGGWDLPPDELEKRKGVSPEFTTTYWAVKGNQSVFSKSKSTETAESFQGIILDIKDPRKLWTPAGPGDPGKTHAKILRNEGIELPAKTLICEVRDSISKPFLCDTLDKGTTAAMKACGAGKSCATCRFAQPEEYDGETLKPMCKEQRRVILLCLDENGLPQDIKVIEASSDMSIKAIKSFQSSLDARRPYMSYITKVTVEPFNNKSGTTFYRIKLAVVGNTPLSMKEQVEAARDRALGLRSGAAATAPSGTNQGSLPAARPKSGEDDSLTVDDVPF